MNSYYVDTSVLVKMYHRKADTDAMLTLYHGTDKLLISELAKIELLSTVSRKYREHGITHETLEAVIQKCEDDIDQRYELVKFSSLVINEARKDFRRLFQRNTIHLRKDVSRHKHRKAGIHDEHREEFQQKD